LMLLTLHVGTATSIGIYEKITFKIKKLQNFTISLPTA
jgi:hypothetical protein